MSKSFMGKNMVGVVKYWQQRRKEGRFLSTIGGATCCISQLARTNLWVQPFDHHHSWRVQRGAGMVGSRPPHNSRSTQFTIHPPSRFSAFPFSPDVHSVRFIKLLKPKKKFGANRGTTSLPHLSKPFVAQIFWTTKQTSIEIRTN